MTNAFLDVHPVSKNLNKSSIESIVSIVSVTVTKLVGIERKKEGFLHG